MKRGGGGGFEKGRTYEEGEEVAEFGKVICVGEFGSALRIGFGVDAVDFGDYLVLDFGVEG